MRHISKTDNILRRKSKRSITIVEREIPIQPRRIESPKSDSNRSDLDTITGIGSTSGFPAEELIEEEMVSVPDVPSSDLEAINDPDSTEEYLNESDTQILFEDQALESNEKKS